MTRVPRLGWILWGGEGRLGWAFQLRRSTGPAGRREEGGERVSSPLAGRSRGQCREGPSPCG